MAQGIAPLERVGERSVGECERYWQHINFARSQWHQVSFRIR